MILVLSTPWVRDEVLPSDLQYRSVKEDLLTFLLQISNLKILSILPKQEWK